jgi:hypothetical protein
MRAVGIAAVAGLCTLIVAPAMAEGLFAGKNSSRQAMFKSQTRLMDTRPILGN